MTKRRKLLHNIKKWFKGPHQPFISKAQGLALRYGCGHSYQPKPNLSPPLLLTILLTFTLSLYSTTILQAQVNNTDVVPPVNMEQATRMQQDQHYQDSLASARRQQRRNGLYRTQRHHFFQIINDNDSYTLTANDGYYTNGLKLIFGWTNINKASDAYLNQPAEANKDTNSDKDNIDSVNQTERGLKGRSQTIHSMEIGQLMYNAKNGSYRYKDELDRPVTAFLYIRYAEQHFTKNQSLLGWGITLGTIGPPALGRQMQQSIHSLFNMYTPEEWDYQLKTEVGLNADFTWSPTLQLSENPNSPFKLLPVVAASVGNTFTGTSLGSVLSLGKMGTNNQTAFWKAHLNNTENESFFYLYPEMVLSVYNATIQGGLFRSDKGPYTGQLNHLRYRQTIGWMHSGPIFNIGLNLIYDARESKTQLHNQWYGRVQFGFAF